MWSSNNGITVISSQQAFYGDAKYHPLLSAANDTMDKLNSIDVAEFFRRTETDYVVVNCMYGESDCRRNWTAVGTIMGRCLRLDLNEDNVISTRDR